MEIEVQQYNESLEAEWDSFIDRNERNATFLHSRKFFRHNPLNDIDDASLLFYKKARLIAVLPATLYTKEEKIIFQSHLRCTYGGFVTDVTTGVEEAIQIVEATIAFAKSKMVHEIVIRNPFRVYHRMPSDESDYAMWYHGFTIKSRELECAIKLDEHAEAKYEDGTRRSTKKAWKSVTVKENEEYDIFWQILTTNLMQKHDSKPTHTLEQFMHLKDLVGSDKIKLIGGYIEDKLVSGIVLFICKPLTLHAQYIAFDSIYQGIRPLNAVIDYIIKWGHENGFKYLNLGMANEEAGRKINYGLFRFKEGFGGRGIIRETMSLILE